MIFVGRLLCLMDNINIGVWNIRGLNDYPIKKQALNQFLIICLVYLLI